MPEIVKCPKCERQLRVPDNLLGKKVKCPSCGTMFTAGATQEEEPEIAEAELDQEPELGKKKKPTRRDELEDDQDRYDENEYEDRPRRRKSRRRDAAPHRGSLILTLGILSLVVCHPLGLFAWIMGNNDLKE